MSQYTTIVLYGKKTSSLVTELEEEEIGIRLHSEIWEVKEWKKHKTKIEELSEIHGFSYCLTSRPDRIGGGC